jgi:hypothetical protein
MRITRRCKSSVFRESAISIIPDPLVDSVVINNSPHGLAGHKLSRGIMMIEHIKLDKIELFRTLCTTVVE